MKHQKKEEFKLSSNKKYLNEIKQSVVGMLEAPSHLMLHATSLEFKPSSTSSIVKVEAKADGDFVNLKNTMLKS